jgi:hypothetical protein
VVASTNDDPHCAGSIDPRFAEFNKANLNA